ncbi:MAG: HXXEE domain-containing protein [Campylobacter sp.]|nr:HXXEE domain-containing protein [Campylobacter sp.]
MNILNTPFYYWAWAWVGLGFAVALIYLLAKTDLLRADVATKRWQDPVWLGWLGTMLYLLHNVEEYAVDIYGNLYAFGATMQKMVTDMNITVGGEIALPTPLFFTVVNLGVVWIAFPIAAILAKRYPLMGLSFLGIIIINGFSHVAQGIMNGYNVGEATSIVLFFPVAIYMTLQNFGKGKPYAYKWFWAIMGCSVILHAILMGSLAAFFKGVLSIEAITWIQVINPFIWLWVSYVMAKKELAGRV